MGYDSRNSRSVWTACAFTAAFYFRVVCLFRGQSLRAFAAPTKKIYRCVPALLTAPVITSLQLAGADVRIRFTTLTNKLYGVDYRNDLATGSWTSLTNNVTGTGGIITITDPGAASRSRRFYRIRLTVP